MSILYKFKYYIMTFIAGIGVALILLLDMFNETPVEDADPLASNIEDKEDDLATIQDQLDDLKTDGVEDKTDQEVIDYWSNQ